MNARSKSSPSATRGKLIDAGVELIRTRGFNGTTVDDICKAAGVTKGGFFHYFESKDDLAGTALTTFSEARTELFRDAPFRALADPLDRFFGRLDFERVVILDIGKTKGCLAGMLAQELALSRKEFREACGEFFARRIEDVAADLAAAKASRPPLIDFDPAIVARFYVSAVQGSQILSKVSGTLEPRLEALEHIRGYVAGLFGKAAPEEQGHKAEAAKN